MGTDEYMSKKVDSLEEEVQRTIGNRYVDIFSSEVLCAVPHCQGELDTTL